MYMYMYTNTCTHECTLYKYICMNTHVCRLHLSCTFINIYIFIYTPSIHNRTCVLRKRTKISKRRGFRSYHAGLNIYTCVYIKYVYTYMYS